MADLGPLNSVVASRFLVHSPGTASSAFYGVRVAAIARPSIPGPPPMIQYGMVVDMPDHPVWWQPLRGGNREFAIYSVRGYVRQLANQQEVPVKNARVRLYLRSTGVAVGSAVTGEDGSYEFQRLMYDASGYYAVALDPDGEPLQNSLVLDRLTPVLT